MFFMSLRVLLVDDDVDCAESLKLYLESRGFRVEVAKSGGQAQVLLARMAPQVVVTDLRLPDMPGNAVASLAREGGAGVIALTGDPEPEGRFDIVLQKPCPPRTIVSAVESLAHQLGRVKTTLA
jgi:DNA-binding response OmpR family regulator